MIGAGAGGVAHRRLDGRWLRRRHRLRAPEPVAEVPRAVPMRQRPQRAAAVVPVTSRFSDSIRADNVRRRANTMPNAMPAKKPKPAVESLPTMPPTAQTQDAADDDDQERHEASSPKA